MRIVSPKLALMALGLLALTAFSPSAPAEQPLGKMKAKSITLALGDDGFTLLHMTGTAEELGSCACYGELVFVPGDEEGTLDGTGVVAFTAASGDMLVGVIAADLEEDGSFCFVIHWRDAVTFSDGTTIDSSGRFANRRPPGLKLAPSNQF